MTIIIVAVVSAVVGLVAGWLIRDHNAKTDAAVTAAVAEVKKL